MYTVLVADDPSPQGHAEQAHPSRHAAIEAAKTISQDTWRPVRIEGPHGRESFTYRRGELERYEYEVRRRRQ